MSSFTALSSTSGSWTSARLSPRYDLLLLQCGSTISVQRSLSCTPILTVSGAIGESHFAPDALLVATHNSLHAIDLDTTLVTQSCFNYGIPRSIRVFPLSHQSTTYNLPQPTTFTAKTDVSPLPSSPPKPRPIQGHIALLISDQCVHLALDCSLVTNVATPPSQPLSATVSADALLVATSSGLFASPLPSLRIDLAAKAAQTSHALALMRSSLPSLHPTLVKSLRLPLPPSVTSFVMTGGDAQQPNPRASKSALAALSAATSTASELTKLASSIVGSHSTPQTAELWQATQELATAITTYQSRISDLLKLLAGTHLPISRCTFEPGSDLEVVCGVPLKELASKALEALDAADKEWCSHLTTLVEPIKLKRIADSSPVCDTSLRSLQFNGKEPVVTHAHASRGAVFLHAYTSSNETWSTAFNMANVDVIRFYDSEKKGRHLLAILGGGKLRLVDYNSLQWVKGDTAAAYDIDEESVREREVSGSSIEATGERGTCVVSGDKVEMFDLEEDEDDEDEDDEEDDDDGDNDMDET